MNEDEKALLRHSLNRGMNCGTDDHKKEIKELLYAGTSPLLKDEQGLTPLHGCVLWEDIENIELILERGEDINVKDNQGDTPFLYYLTAPSPYTHRYPKYDTNIIKFLIDNGADVNIEAQRKNFPNEKKIYNIMQKDTGINGKSPIHYLSEEKDYLESIRYLVEAGANIDKKDEDGNTPLMSAISSANTEVAQYLIEKGANINTKNNQNQTLLMKFDLGLTSTTDNENDNKKLFGSNNEEQVKELYELILQNTHDMNSVDKDCRNILMYTLANNTNSYTPILPKYRCVKLLLSAGIKNIINEKDKDGETVLMKAVQLNLDDIVELFIENGANLNLIDNQGQTALMKAVSSYSYSDNRSLWTVKLLIKNGADVHIKDCDGCNALMHLSSSNTTNKYAVAEIFLEKYSTIDINAKDINNKTAFDKAIATKRFGHNLHTDDGLDYIIKLIEHGATYKNEDGSMPWSTERHNMEIVYYIVREKKEKIQNPDLQILLKNTLKNKDFEAAKYFISEGADINKFEHNLLTTSIRDEEDIELIQFMLEKCAKVNRPHGKDKTVTALTMTLVNKKDEMRKLIMKQNPNITLTLEYLLKNDLYFHRDDFKRYLEELIPDTMSKKEKQSLLMKWSCFNQRVDVDKIEKCIFLLEVLEIPITRNPVTDWRGNPVYKRIDTDDIKTALENSLHPVEHTTFKHILKQYIDLSKHDPKRLTTILKKFSSDERLKYTNHPWDGDSLTYDRFISDAEYGFDEIKNDLESLAPELYKALRKLILSKDNRGRWMEKKREEIQKEIKNLMVIKEDDRDLKLLKIFTPFKHKYDSLKINLDAIKSLSFTKIFTNREDLCSALDIIFKDITDHFKGTNYVSVQCKKDEESIEIRIIHPYSHSIASSETLKEAINGGNFSTIYKNLTSVCDWSIETVCQDKKGYRIDYLDSENDTVKLTCSDGTPEGFTHILRFYK